MHSNWSNAAPGQPVYGRFLAFGKCLLQGATESALRLESELKGLIQGDRSVFEFAVEFEDKWNQLNDAKKSKSPSESLSDDA
jgi:hypothetical protein